MIARSLDATDHQQNGDEMIEMFAGRIFAEEIFKWTALQALRHCLRKPSLVRS
jgi:hypothetical protein